MLRLRVACMRRGDGVSPAMGDGEAVGRLRRQLAVERLFLVLEVSA
jgi:hypothetical protein